MVVIYFFGKGLDWVCLRIWGFGGGGWWMVSVGFECGGAVDGYGVEVFFLGVEVMFGMDVGLFGYRVGAG